MTITKCPECGAQIGADHAPDCGVARCLNSATRAIAKGVLRRHRHLAGQVYAAIAASSIRDDGRR